jgi:hypothetical protein
MAWYEITDAEIAPRQPLDSELFKKIKSNLVAGVANIGLGNAIPNGSFENTTGVVPLLWSITAVGNGAATIATGAHGANSFKLTKTTGATSGVYAYTDDYIVQGSSAITLHGIIWGAGATVNEIKGGIVVQQFERDLTPIATNIIYNTTGRSATPTTYSMSCTISSNTRWIKVGCVCGTDCTVAGSLYFDGLSIRGT